MNKTGNFSKVQSWVLRGFTAAEEKVFVGLEEAEKLVQG